MQALVPEGQLEPAELCLDVSLPQPMGKWWHLLWALYPQLCQELKEETETIVQDME